MSLLIRRARAAALAATALATMLIATLLVAVSPAQAESNGGVRVMPLGDSITDGYNVPGGYRNGLWQQSVSAGYKVDFVGSQFNGPSSLGDHDHEGHSGWTISQIDANVTSWLRNSTPRTVLLHIGTNDMYGDTSGAPARLGTLLDHITAAAPNADVFVATIITSTGRDGVIRGFNAALPGLVQSRATAGKRVHLVDMYSALSTSDLADGIHPNSGGYQKMSGVWFRALQAVPGSLGDGSTTPTSPVDTSAVYVLVNRNSGKALDVYNLATNDGARITQWTRNNGNQQQWQFVDSGGGYYRLKSRLSGKVLDVYNFSTADGAAIVQWSDGNGTNQQFSIQTIDGYLQLINRNSGKAMEVQGASTADGGNVVQYADWNGANQQWQLVRVG